MNERPAQDAASARARALALLARREHGAAELSAKLKRAGCPAELIQPLLESLQADPARAPAADLHYCTRDADGDAFVARLRTLCAPLPGIVLHVHGARQGHTLKAEALDARSNAEIWFCGPSGLAEALRHGLQAMGGKARFHQEAFEMR